ncbi:head-tail connector protein [Tumebacillus permanentifrigoris]|uniref:Putative phage protein (Predicted DNA packaging) n=1 Tax=Tumebacillus permanentifrigoris TaxID=378543 RepID=A0A316DQ64_9BACL|nr:head-tail connector protein [Tumebacillus permanentifrigoris]PWK05306.1 putative phage protein (predicted DNA packaging) [Tumebacillus permanentifrigoris]
MLEDVKQYLRVDGDEDDALVTELIEGAQLYIQNACGYKNWSTPNALARQALRVLVVHWYENRAATDVKAGSALAFSLEHIIYQLRYCADEEVPSP